MIELSTARAVILGMPDPALLLDHELKLIAYNSRFLALSGLRRRALETRLTQLASPFDLVGTFGAIEREHATQCLASGRPMNLAELSVARSHGMPMTVHITFIPVLGSDGKALGLIECMRDVSGEARVQARYNELLVAERSRADQLEREVAKRTLELTSALAEVTRMSREDPLTGLLNRRAFVEVGELAVRHARRHRRVVAALATDLDFFKRVNDTYGHQAGDAVLVETANVLKRAFRDTDRVARFGGEEFVVLLSETGPEFVPMIAERLRTLIEQHGATMPIPGVKFPTMSIGAAMFPEHAGTLEALLARADQALYAAKAAGRNRVVIYDPAP